MDRSARHDVLAVIFCGGEHLRLGRLGSAQAKALLVAHDTPLLWRLVDQLRVAGFDRIVAATTPRLEREIGDSLERYAASAANAADIRVEARAEQAGGVLLGLRSLLSTAGSERFLLCLGDLYSLGNPFPPLAHLDGPHDVLVTARPALQEELALGGILTVDGERVRALLERPTAVPPPGALRWAGIALAERRPALEAMEGLLAHTGEAPPPGDLFEAARARGRELRAIPGPDFVNVNSPDHLLLASLYARLEGTPEGEAAGPVRDAARALREEIARRGRARST